VLSTAVAVISSGLRRHHTSYCFRRYCSHTAATGQRTLDIGMASSLASCAGHHHHTAATIDVGSLADCLSSDKLGYSLGAGRSCHCNSCCDRHFSCIESELGTEIQFVPHHIFSRIPRSIATTVSKLLNDQVGSNSCHLVGFGQASHPASLSQSCSKDKYPVKTVIL